ncbi:hypothetical protein [Actinoallomurus sp. CA-142502]|uniref:hypothetical protein n=1 Tax=Actinoallomurus sp. CA-142502 TaxID=3239885 RepID=UPI003D930260
MSVVPWARVRIWHCFPSTYPDAFPCGGPDHDGWERSMRGLQASVRRASATGRRDVQGPMQHDIP